jgi:hypothetical protein
MAPAKKKGAGASPLRQLTPQKPEHSRGCVPATPGSQYFVCVDRLQVSCQLKLQAHSSFMRLKQWGLAPGKHSRNAGTLQNLTDELAVLSILWEKTKVRHGIFLSHAYKPIVA